MLPRLYVLRWKLPYAPGHLKLYDILRKINTYLSMAPCSSAYSKLFVKVEFQMRPRMAPFLSNHVATSWFYLCDLNSIVMIVIYLDKT